MSEFHLDTREQWWTLFYAHLFSRAVWREGCCKQHWHVLTVSQPHWACPCSQHVCPPCPHCSGSSLLHQELSNAGPGLHAPSRSKPLRFRYSGAEELKSSEAQPQLCLRFVPFPGPSSSGDQVFGKCSCCDLLPPLSLPLSFLGVQPEHLLRWMLTVQSPKKS